jgi:DNA polymerase-3 subunit delta
VPRSIAETGSPKQVKFVFSPRGGHSYRHVQAYIELLSKQTADGRIYQTARAPPDAHEQSRLALLGRRNLAMRPPHPPCYPPPMAEKKNHEVDAWLARPDPKFAIVLVHGPDRGLVAERARQFAAKSGVPLDDAFSVVRLDAGEVERDPGRLADEAGTISMFSARRLIWIRDAGAGRPLADAVQALAAAPPPDTVVLIEAGDLKKGAALRTVVEGSAVGMALPCYADDQRSIDMVIDAAMQKAGITIALEARQVLKRNLGGDRLASRGEIDKLITYCQGQSTIEVEDVIAATGDASGVSADAVVDAALLGKADELDLAFSRFVAGGNPLFQLLNTALRQFHALDQLRSAMDVSGKSASAAVAGARPPIFFARKATVETALSRWSRRAISGALERLQGTVLSSRQRADLATPVVRHCFLALAAESQRLSRQ